MKTKNYKDYDVKMDYSPFFESLKEAQLSQNQLKENYDISAATISRMKNGRNMTVETLGKLMQILEIDDFNKMVTISYKKKKK